MRIGFKTTLDEKLLERIKVDALKKKVNVNDILEQLIEKYLNGETKITIRK